jgi:hypothetical protein
MGWASLFQIVFNEDKLALFYKKLCKELILLFYYD